jgi:hypothetical protein
MINLDKNFGYIHLPKTGGHSVYHFFDAGVPRKHDMAVRVRIEHPEIFLFTTVRNTWESLVSSYEYYEYYKMFTFEKFIYEKLLSDHPNDSYHLIHGQLYWIGFENRIFVDFIMSTNHLTNHLEKLCEKINYPFCVDKVQKLNVTKRKDYRFYYNHSKMIDNVYEKFKEDIDFFGFDFENNKKIKEDIFCSSIYGCEF